MEVSRRDFLRASTASLAAGRSPVLPGSARIWRPHWPRRPSSESRTRRPFQASALLLRRLRHARPHPWTQDRQRRRCPAKPVQRGHALPERCGHLPAARESQPPDHVAASGTWGYRVGGLGARGLRSPPRGCRERPSSWCPCVARGQHSSSVCHRPRAHHRVQCVPWPSKSSRNGLAGAAGDFAMWLGHGAPSEDPKPLMYPRFTQAFLIGIGGGSAAWSAWRWSFCRFLLLTGSRSGAASGRGTGRPTHPQR
jgi:hypothetical protein